MFIRTMSADNFFDVHPIIFIIFSFGSILLKLKNARAISKESVRQWVLKFEEAFASRGLTTKKDQPVILLDETKLKRHGRIAYVSVCLDLEQREVISTQCKNSISIVSTVGIVREALQICVNANPLLLVDHSPWYKPAFDWIRDRFYAKDILHQELRREVVPHVQATDEEILQQFPCAE